MRQPEIPALEIQGDLPLDVAATTGVVLAAAGLLLLQITGNRGGESVGTNVPLQGQATGGNPTAPDALPAGAPRPCVADSSEGSVAGQVSGPASGPAAR